MQGPADLHEPRRNHTGFGGDWRPPTDCPWGPPTGERFVKIYGGPLDGSHHPASAYYAAAVDHGGLQFLDWVEAE